MTGHKIYMRVYICHEANDNKCAITIDFIENTPDV